jgi:hypothetical protein
MSILLASWFSSELIHENSIGIQTGLYFLFLVLLLAERKKKTRSMFTIELEFAIQRNG